MTTVSRWANDVAENKWVVLASSVTSLVSFYFDLRHEFQNFFLNLALAASLIVFFALAFYSVRVRERLLSHQRSARLVHDINHEYRNVLNDTFGTALQNSEPIDPAWVTREREIIETVCHRIAEIYEGLVSRPCIVTVKIITKENGNLFCHTYARSEPSSRRDRGSAPGAYTIGTGENTAFDVAIQPGPGDISHFYSGNLPDMKKHGQYRNRRDNFEKYYKSAIIVPIRSQPSQQSVPNNRGFLCVDTLSTHCLNDGYHVELLAAFADQMYNFFSLMRGTYRLPPNMKG